MLGKLLVGILLGPAVLGWIQGLTGFSTRSSFAIGSGMVSRGEVALIVAATGLQAGLLLPQYFTTVIITIILTTLIAPPMLKFLFITPRVSTNVKT